MEYLDAIVKYLTEHNLDVFLPSTVVIFLLIVPWGANVWQNVFTFTFLLKGTGLLLFPQAAADFMIKKDADALHLQEIRCFGTLLITDAVANILLRKSTDPTVKTTLLWSRTIFIALLAMVSYCTSWVAAESKKNYLNLKLLETSSIAHVLVFAGFLFYSLSQSDWGGYQEPATTRRNFHIRTDFKIWFLHGIITIIYPKLACQFQTNLEQLDTAHGFLARLMGAGFLCVALLSWRCVHFLREEDKKSVLLSHALGSLLNLMTMAFCQLFTKVFSHWHLLYGMTIVAVTLINAALASDVVVKAKAVVKELTTKTIAID